MALILLRQICMMFLLIALGVFLIKKNFLSEQGGKDLGAILLRIVIPCVILKSYITDHTPERAAGLAISAGMALIAFLTAMVISCIIFGKRRRIENFGASFCNVGFMGIPLVQSVFGDEAVFYLVSYIALLNVFQWTYGVFILTGDRDVIRIKRIITNPAIVAFLLGLIIFFLKLPVPKVIVSTLSSIAAMNTPIAMIILGSYLVKMSVSEMFASKSAFLCVFVRLVVIPLVTLAVIYMIPGVRMEIRQVILIACSTPVGANVAIFAKQYDKDYRLSVVMVCLSTILCIITVPAFYMIAERVMGL